MILRADNVSISFGERRVLDGVGFAIPHGQTVALMGPNGAGKTTILRCVLGLVDYRGTIEVDGFDVRRRGVAARGRIGYVPQVPAFFDLTAREMLHFVARLRRAPVQEADGALERMGLGQHADRRVRAFSGGMQQRLSLAAVLLGDPPLILLDEPTANLDPVARVELLELLQGFRAEGKTLVLSSHRPREVRGLVDRVVVLREGKVAADGPPASVLPPDRMVLRVEAHGSEEKRRIESLLESHGVELLPTRNGTFNGSMAAEEIVPVVERLRAGGVETGRIRIECLEDGGIA